MVTNYYYIGMINGYLNPFIIFLIIPGLLIVIILITYIILMFVYSMLLILNKIKTKSAEDRLRIKGKYMLFFQIMFLLVEIIMQLYYINIMNVFGYGSAIYNMIVLPGEGWILDVIGGIIAIIGAKILKSLK